MFSCRLGNLTSTLKLSMVDNFKFQLTESVSSYHDQIITVNYWYLHANQAPHKNTPINLPEIKPGYV